MILDASCVSVAVVTEVGSF